MTTLTIEIPDKDRDLFEKITERLNGKIVKSENNNRPNSVTKKAIADARLGKIHKIENLDLFFQNL